jgi:hypothetical protein
MHPFPAFKLSQDALEVIAKDTVDISPSGRFAQHELATFAMPFDVS